MRGYVMIGTNDLNLSEAFYSKLLDTIGLKKKDHKSSLQNFRPKKNPLKISKDLQRVIY